MSQDDIRILLADDHAVLRAGLQSLLNRIDDMTVVAEVGRADDVLPAAEQCQPHVVVLDVSLTGGSGVQVAESLQARLPQVAILALSMHIDRDTVSRMLRAGALGYVCKSCTADELVRAIRAVAAGRAFVSPEVAAFLVEDCRRSDASVGAAALTPREREVVKLIADGLSTRQVAQRLNISPKTVETHRSNIMEKLGLGSIPQLTKFAVREGLTSLED